MVFRWFKKGPRKIHEVLVADEEHGQVFNYLVGQAEYLTDALGRLLNETSLGREKRKEYVKKLLDWKETLREIKEEVHPSPERVYKDVLREEDTREHLATIKASIRDLAVLRAVVDELITNRMRAAATRMEAEAQLRENLRDVVKAIEAGDYRRARTVSDSHELLKGQEELARMEDLLSRYTAEEVIKNHIFEGELGKSLEEALKAYREIIRKIKERREE